MSDFRYMQVVFLKEIQSIRKETLGTLTELHIANFRLLKVEAEEEQEENVSYEYLYVTSNVSVS